MESDRCRVSEENCVVLAMVSDTWTDAVRRGFYSTADQLFLSLMADDRVKNVILADHPRGLMSQLRRRSGGDKPAPTTPVLSGVRPVTLRTGLPRSTSGVISRYRSYDRQIQFAGRLRRVTRPSLVTFNLWHAAYGNHEGYHRVIFYAQDDEREIPRLAHLRDRISAAYAAIAARGMTVCAVSDELLSRIAPLGNGQVIPNGVDPALWIAPSRGARGSDLPTAKYVGTIDDRIDVAAVQSLTDAGFAVHMAGPNKSAAIFDELSAIPGVRLFGSIPRQEVPRFLMSADVCFLAHRRTRLTEAMSPLKVYEYLCSGRPVVATSLPGILGDPELRTSVLLVEATADFGTIAASALDTADLSESERHATVARFSWRSRHADIIDLLVSV